MRQLRPSNRGWEGSHRQSSGPRNTNRIRGVCLVGEGANRPEARSHPDWMGVYAAGRWSESHAPYPGRSVVLLETARVAERRHDGAAEVSDGHSSPAEPR